MTEIPNFRYWHGYFYRALYVAIEFGLYLADRVKGLGVRV